MTVIIFDFDGTIADTLEAVVHITNRLAPEFGYRPLSTTDVRHLRNLNTQQILRQSEISVWQLPFLLRRLRAELGREIESIHPIDGLQEALHLLIEQNYRLGIVTSNSADNVTAFLDRHHLKSCFEFVHSGTTLFGKTRVIRQVLRQYQLPPSQAVYVGDETRDIEAAQRIPVAVIAVSWGFNTPQALAAYHPDQLVQQPADLIEAIQSLASRQG